MKRAMFIVVGVIFAATGQVRGDLVVRTLPKVPVADGTVGVYTPAGGGGILSNYDLSVVVGQTVQLTFAFHWPYAIPVAAQWIQHRLQYDSSEVEVIGFSGIAPFGVPLNYDPNTIIGQLPNPGTGTVRFGLFEQGVTTPFIVSPSGVFPFLHITFKVNNVLNDTLLDIRVPGNRAATGNTFPFTTGGLAWNYFTTTVSHTALSNLITNINVTTGSPHITLGGIFIPAHGVNVVPEPSLTWLLGAFVAFVAAFWRRRHRRMEKNAITLTETMSSK